MVARRFAGLMSALGLERFGVHGADIGSQIAEQLTLQHPERVIGLHLGDVPLRRLRALPADQLDDEERAWTVAAAAVGRSPRARTATSSARSRRPSRRRSTTPPPGSRAGCWRSSRAGPTIPSAISLDELCTNLTIYWVTQTAGSAARYYFDARVAPTCRATPVDRADRHRACSRKTCCAAPRHSAERWFDIRRFTEMPAGGHFGPWEQPQAWAAEITAFFDEVEP